MIRNLNRKILHFGCLLATAFATTHAVGAKPERESYTYYYLDADVVSLDSKQSLASYRAHGHVSGMPGSTIGCSTPNTEINIALLVEADRFYADLTLTDDSKSKDGEKHSEEKKQRVDLSNLRPVSINVGAEKDGRTYQLNLVPAVKSVRLTPKLFREVADDLYQLKFHMSRVTLNDKQYIGNMLASSADYFSVEICGVASIEFSLKHMKDAKPLGALNDGQITITNSDGTTIAISNVTNGKDDRLILGGPYTVWVRWNKPQATVEQYRAALQNWRDEMVKGTTTNVGGDTKSEGLKRVDQELAREAGPWVVGCGAHDLQKREIVSDE